MWAPARLRLARGEIRRERQGGRVGREDPSGPINRDCRSGCGGEESRQRSVPDRSAQHEPFARPVGDCRAEPRRRRRVGLQPVAEKTDRRVPVGDDEPGQERAAVELDDPGQAAAKGERGLLVADALDAAGANGDRLGDAA